MKEKKKLKSVLLIDDNSATNLIHRKMLSIANKDCEIFVCTDALEALEHVSKQLPPDLIFLDINMPEMDGWAFLEEYRALMLKGTEAAVIYVLSSSINPNDRNRAAEMRHISGFITKPLSVKAVTNLLAEHFD